MLEPTDLQAREPFRQLAASLPLPLLVIGPEDEIVFANPASERFFGAAADLLSGRVLPDVKGSHTPLLSVIAQVRARDAPVEACDVPMRRSRGGDRLVDIVGAPYASIRGAVVVTLHEREFAQRMHRQRAFHDGLRSLNGMAAVLAHEIKNPLLGIRGAAQLLEENLGEPERCLTQLICAESDRIRVLIDSMEAFGDARERAFNPVNVHEVLDRARAIARNGFASHAKFRDAFDPSLPLVSGDCDRLIQVFVNVLRNASDAIPETGGEIYLATAFCAGVSLGTDGGARRALPLEVTVRDNGSGIAPHLLPHIFDPFVTTKQRGAGLGLALVTKIVSEHGGMVECDSVPGRTEFRVLLPVLKGQP